LTLGRWRRQAVAFVVAGALVTACGGDDSDAKPDEDSDTAEVTDDSGATDDDGGDEATEATEATQPVNAGPTGDLVVAISAQPATLDVHITTQNLTQEIGYHMYEGLFTIGSAYEPVPLLVDEYTFDEATLTYKFNLRPDIEFHDGSAFDSADVVASLNRWMERSNNGVTMGKVVQEIRAIDPLTVELQLAEPFAPAIQMLTFPNQGAGIYPSEVIDAAGEGDITEFIGTGPFQFVELVPDQQVTLAANPNYSPRSEPANGMAGERRALVSELVFRVVPEVSIRRDMVVTGEADVGEDLASDMYDGLLNEGGVETIITKPWWSPLSNINKRTGPLSDVAVRQAFLAALDMESLMVGAFGTEDFYRLDPSTIFQENAEWWSDAGAEFYNQNDPDRAREMLEATSYDGEPIIWLTNRERPFMFAISTVAKEQLEAVGFNIELEVVDTATIAARRSEFEGWSLYDTANLFLPDPSTWVILDSSVIGWWEDDHKDQLVTDMNSELDPVARKAIWDELQAYIWDQVPVIKYGDFFLLGVRGADVEGLVPSPFPYYWNVTAGG
jgi:peptide/nickel transport system substrate-binding protein